MKPEQHETQTQTQTQDGSNDTNGTRNPDRIEVGHTPQANCPAEYRATVRGAFEADPSSEGGSVENVLVNSDLGLELKLCAITDDFSWAVKPGEDGQCNGHCNIELDCLDVSGKMWSSGTVSLTGGNVGVDKSTRAFEIIHSDLRAAGVETEWHPVEVSNIVVSFDSLTDCDGFDDCERFNLTGINLALGSDCQYEPEQFSGLIRRFDSGETCTIYSTGCGHISGAQSVRDALDRREQLLTRLDSYGLI